MYIADLAPWQLASIEDTGQIRAIGWLERGHDYSRGDVPKEVMRALVNLLIDPWQPYVSAGVHRCSFCRFTGGPGEIRFESTMISVGNSNIFVPVENFIYVAPSLIIHYMDAHEYAPPVEFQQGILSCPPMRSVAYLKAIRDRSNAIATIRMRRQAR